MEVKTCCVPAGLLTYLWHAILGGTDSTSSINYRSYLRLAENFLDFDSNERAFLIYEYEGSDILVVVKPGI
ncbi:hypothetical protein H5410_053245 [Solanum commersonii]|uniref:Uncharacterized protein n=1 Tax=Solanum commersonii TaxID=4109 RepID=A0A9J5X3W1_SOLCO|nr:hypothetical protein H5410_053245 [Solanum commersonii]